MNKYKFLIVLFLIGIIFLLAYNFFFKREKEYLTKTLLPSIRVNKFFLTETYQGKKVWEIKADTAQILENEAKLKNIQVKFFLKENNFFTIVADEGKINTLSKNFTVIGKVIVTLNNKLSLKTDTLNWDSEKEEIYTNSSVEVAKDNFTITGEGLKLLPHVQEAEILHNVKIVIR